MTPSPDSHAAKLASLSLEEKASLTSGADFWNTKPIPGAGVPAVLLTDGPHGVRRQAEGDDHVGLNASVPATCFPPAAALGSTWDPELLERIGRALGEEAKAGGVSVLLGPGINIKRPPAGRPELRVPLRGPGPDRRARRRPREGDPVPGGGGLAEALRGEQPGGRPGPGQRRRRPPPPAGGLPARVPEGRHGRPALTAAREGNQLAALLTDPEGRALIGSFPLNRLAAFPASPLTRHTVEELLEGSGGA